MKNSNLFLILFIGIFLCDILPKSKANMTASFDKNTVNNENSKEINKRNKKHFKNLINEKKEEKILLKNEKKSRKLNKNTLNKQLNLIHKHKKVSSADKSLTLKTKIKQKQLKTNLISQKIKEKKIRKLQSKNISSQKSNLKAKEDNSTLMKAKINYPDIGLVNLDGGIYDLIIN